MASRCGFNFILNIIRELEDKQNQALTYMCN